MLFNSLPFLFVFLPLTFFGFWLALRFSPRAAVPWLLAASLCFYAYWKLDFLYVLVVSMLWNYSAGALIVGQKARKNPQAAKLLLTVAIAGNLLLLGVFKYAGFVLQTVGQFDLGAIPTVNLALPLGISFYTITQIAFLVDTYRSRSTIYPPADYALFVTFFPHLIAGPIYHHAEMIPQFRKPQFNALHVALGLTFFSAGLFKKIVFADPVGAVANRIFDAGELAQLDTASAWVGALSYTLQLYFDFSAYSDMAIGLALLFGIRVPANFNSPYKAASIIEFWRRWHISLTRFLRDCLFVPLGGLRKSRARRFGAIMVTMLLAGLWHGAGWTFIAFGALHGAYLVVNHAWRVVRARSRKPSRIGVILATLLTFLCVMVSLVLFRSSTMGQAISMLHSMVSRSGFLNLMHLDYFYGLEHLALLALLLAIVWFAPNTLELTRRYQPALLIFKDPGLRPEDGETRVSWQPRLAFGLLYGLAALISVVTLIMAPSQTQFLYFQF